MDHFRGGEGGWGGVDAPTSHPGPCVWACWIYPSGTHFFSSLVASEESAASNTQSLSVVELKMYLYVFRAPLQLRKVVSLLLKRNPSERISASEAVFLIYVILCTPPDWLTRDVESSDVIKYVKRILCTALIIGSYLQIIWLNLQDKHILQFGQNIFWEIVEKAQNTSKHSLNISR